MKVTHEFNDLENEAVDENSLDNPKYYDQTIASICSVPSDEKPFPFNYWKKFVLLLAGGTNCRCCMGYRIIGGFVLGSLIGYLLG